MNKGQIKEVEKAITLLEQAKQILSTVRAEERNKFDSLPEELKEIEGNLKIQSNADLLEYYSEEIEEQVKLIENVINENL